HRYVSRSGAVVNNERKECEYEGFLWFRCTKKQERFFLLLPRGAIGPLGFLFEVFEKHFAREDSIASLLELRRDKGSYFESVSFVPRSEWRKMTKVLHLLHFSIA